MKTVDLIEQTLIEEMRALRDTRSIAEALYRKLLQSSDQIRMHYLANEDKGIVGCPSFASAQSSKQGGTIAMGVNNPYFQDFALREKYIPFLYLIDRKDYRELTEMLKDK